MMTTPGRASARCSMHQQGGNMVVGATAACHRQVAAWCAVPRCQPAPLLQAGLRSLPLAQPPRSQHPFSSGSSSSSSSSSGSTAAPTTAPLQQQQQQLTDLLLMSNVPELANHKLLEHEAAPPSAEVLSDHKAAHLPAGLLDTLGQQLEHALASDVDGPPAVPDAPSQDQQLPQQQQQQQQLQQWLEFQSESEHLVPSLPAGVLCELLLFCGAAGITPSLQWLRSALTAVLNQMDDGAAVPEVAAVLPAPAAALGTLRWPAGMGATAGSSSAALLLPRVLNLLLSWGSGQALQPLCVRGVWLLRMHIHHMQHEELGHLLHAMLTLRQAGVELALDSQAGPAKPALGAVLPHAQQRVQQLHWQQEHLTSLVDVVSCLAALDAPGSSTWLASCVRDIGHAHTARLLTGQQVLDLAEALRTHGPNNASAHPSAPAATAAAALTGVSGGHESQATCWLLWWLDTTAQAVLVRDLPHMTTPQLLSAAALLHDIRTSAVACPTPAVPASSMWVEAGEDEDGMCPLLDLEPASNGVPGLLPHAPEELVLQEVQARLLALPALELVHYATLLLSAPLPQAHLRQLLTACLPRLVDLAGQLQPREAVSLLLSLARCQLQEEAQPHVLQPLVRELLAHTRALLPSCQLPTLLELVGALAVLRVTPPLAWQDMFFATLRTRLPLLQADELSYMLACVSSLGLQPDEMWVRETFAASRRLLPDMDAAQLADLVWWLSRHTTNMDWMWAPEFEAVSKAKLKQLSPALLAATIKGLNTLGFHPSRSWISAFLEAVQTQLFAPCAMLPCVLSDDGSQASLAQLMTHRTAARTTTRAVSTSSAGAAAPPPELGADMGGSASVDVLMAILDGLTYSRVHPSKHWMHSFTDAMRCKMSLLNHQQLGSVLLFIAGAAYRPEPHWWEDYLSMLGQEQLQRMQIPEMVQTLAVLHALDARPDATWLAAWCAASEERLCLFLPHQLHQVLSCLACCNYTPSLAWLRNCSYALEHCAHALVFEPSEFVRCVVILDRMGQAPRPPLLAMLYSDMGQQGVAHADPAVLAQLMWMLQAASHPPSEEWIQSYIAAAQKHLATFTQLQLESILAGLLAVSAAEREYVSAQVNPGTAVGSGSGLAAVPSYVTSFRLLVREWML